MSTGVTRRELSAVRARLGSIVDDLATQVLLEGCVTTDDETRTWAVLRELVDAYAEITIPASSSNRGYETRDLPEAEQDAVKRAKRALAMLPDPRPQKAPGDGS